MLVNIFNDQSDLPISSPLVETLVKEVLKKEKCLCDEVAIHFVDRKTISKLHEQYFDDPSPTDCISFPLDSNSEQGYQNLGDVFVCPNVALEYAKQHKKDPFTETTLYIIHGLLHLLGYDDLDDISEPVMREAEARHLEHLLKKELQLKKE